MSVFDKLKQDTSRIPWMEKCDIMSPCAGTRLVVNRLDTQRTSSVKRIDRRVDRNSDVVEAGAFTIEKISNRAVIKWFEELKVRLADRQKVDVHPVANLFVSNLGGEQFGVLGRERRRLVGRYADVINLHIDGERRGSMTVSV